MDPAYARLACLKLALGNVVSCVADAKPIVEQAKLMADFVIGPSLRESKNSGATKGQDEK